MFLFCLAVSLSSVVQSWSRSSFGQFAQHLGLGPTRLRPRLGLGSKSLVHECTIFTRLVKKERLVIGYIARVKPVTIKTCSFSSCHPPTFGEILPLLGVFAPSLAGFTKSRFLCVTESSKIAHFLSTNALFQAQNATKRSRPGGTYDDAPPDSLVDWGGVPSYPKFPLSAIRRLKHWTPRIDPSFSF